MKYLRRTTSGAADIGLGATAKYLRLSSLHCADHHPIRIEDERERLVTASPVMTKSRGPSWGKQLPGERPRETAKT
jgi:hypothetical protein